MPYYQTNLIYKRPPSPSLGMDWCDYLEIL